MRRPIPQTDPKAGYLALRDAIDGAMRRVIESGRYILGPEVSAFEREFAAYVGVAHGIGVGNGTDALHLALRALGVGPGDSVLTVSHTAVATVAAVGMCGARAVFVDIDSATYTMDPAALEETIRRFKGTGLKAVLPVHLYGLPADMPAILAVADRYGLPVVEDCAQSHGAAVGGRRAGSFGRLAAFSFYPTKNLGALGDGGMVVTDDEELAGRVRLTREYGWRVRYFSETPGVNSRLDEIQAAVLRVKLAHLDENNAARRRVAERYDDLLQDSGLDRPKGRGGSDHVYHQYVVRSRFRDRLREILAAEGIGTLVHYPEPVHRQPAYAAWGSAGGPLQRTDEVVPRVLSLPMFPELTADEVEAVSRAIARAMRS